MGAVILMGRIPFADRWLHTGGEAQQQQLEACRGGPLVSGTGSSSSASQHERGCYGPTCKAPCSAARLPGKLPLHGCKRVSLVVVGEKRFRFPSPPPSSHRHADVAGPEVMVVHTSSATMPGQEPSSRTERKRADEKRTKQGKGLLRFLLLEFGRITLDMSLSSK